MIIVDTNIICRFLLRDDETLYQKAKNILSSDSFYIDAIIVAESIWVLINHYQLSKSAVTHQILALINQPNSVQPQKNQISVALNIYTTQSVSFIDSWLIAIHQSTKNRLETFDVKLKKISYQYD